MNSFYITLLLITCLFRILLLNFGFSYFSSMSSTQWEPSSAAVGRWLGCWRLAPDIKRGDQRLEFRSLCSTKYPKGCPPWLSAQAWHRGTSIAFASLLFWWESGCWLLTFRSVLEILTSIPDGGAWVWEEQRLHWGWHLRNRLPKSRIRNVS